MKTNENQYYIYSRSTGERIYVTQQEFEDYYRGINTYRKAQQRSKNCVCPERKRLDCDMDCLDCPYYRRGNNLSLDYTETDDDGNEKAWIDDLADPTAPIDEIVANSMELQLLFKRLEEIMPQAIEIGRLRQQGLSEDAIAARHRKKDLRLPTEKGGRNFEKRVPGIFLKKFLGFFRNTLFLSSG